MKIQHNLIEKIHHDLIWWRDSVKETQTKKNRKNEFHDESKHYGIDDGGMDDDNKIKSHWRHVRSRFYFTSASNMYSLLNVIKFGMKQALKTDSSLDT